MRAHISPDSTVIRYREDGSPAPDGWAALECVDVGAALCPGPDEAVDGPAVTIADGVCRRVWTLRAKTDEERWSEIRAERDRRLKASDRPSLALWADRWLAQPQEWRDAWTTYRQALRDLPETFAEAGPQSVIWPEAPAG